MIEKETCREGLQYLPYPALLVEEDVVIEATSEIRQMIGSGDLLKGMVLKEALTRLGISPAHADQLQQGLATAQDCICHNKVHGMQIVRIHQSRWGERMRWFLFENQTAVRSEISDLNRRIRTIERNAREHTLELSRAKEYAENLVDFMQDAIFLLDRSGRVDMINRTVYNMLGYTLDELKGNRLDSLLVLEDLSQREPLVEQICEGALRSFKILMQGVHGEQITVLLTTVLLTDVEGEEYGVLCTARDIRDLQRAESELKQQQAAVVHMGRLTALGEMATGIAHEINQPLAIISAGSEQLQRAHRKGRLSEELIEEVVTELLEESDRIVEIVDHMRDFARTGSNGPLKPVALNQPVTSAQRFFEEQYRIHGIELKCELSHDLLPVKMSARRMEQVVINLLTNARQAVESVDGKDLRRVIVRTFQQGDTALLEVEDSGPGLSEEALERCMEPFYTTKEVGQGTGLGLSISHSIVQQFEGKMSVTNGSSGGACFQLSFPLAAMEVES